MKPSSLAEGNLAFRNKQFERALHHYRKAEQLQPELAHLIQVNIKFATRRLDEVKGRQNQIINTKIINKITSNRVVIYTAVSGAYDTLDDPEIILPNCDYIVFSDRPIESKVWRVRYFNYFDTDVAKTARFVKLHPHLYFPEYKISIWIDANISIVGDPQPFISVIGPDCVMALFPHPHRNCVYVEGEECIKRSKDNADVIQDQLMKYRSRKFPENAGLWETGLLVRRHMDPRCIKLMTNWWREIFLGSRRDQISLPVVISDSGVSVKGLGEKGADLRLNPLLKIKKHSSTSQISTSSREFLQAINSDVHINCQRRIPVDIGVCVYNSPVETYECISSVIADLGPLDRLIIINDSSDAETTKILNTFKNSDERILLITHNVNLGYTRSANDILRESFNPYVILINSDAVMPLNTINRLVACGEHYEFLGIIGPLSNAAGWQSVPVLHDPKGGFLINELPEGMHPSYMATLAAEASVGVVPFVPLVNGFCFAIKRSVIDAIGYLDETAFPIGYGEEDDYCFRAADAGFVCGIATDTYVYHVKSATFKSERRKELTKSGGAALRAKHTSERVYKSVMVNQYHPELIKIRTRIQELLARCR